MFALSMAQVAAAAKDRSITIEFAGFNPSDVLSLKLDNGKKLQTAIGGSGKSEQCNALQETKILIERELDALSPRLAESVALGRLFPRVIVYQGNSQVFLEDVLITSYSVSSSGIAGTIPVESMTLNVANVNAGQR